LIQGTKSQDSRVNDSRIPETEKVKTEIKYLPLEGKAEINTDLNGNTKIIIKNRDCALSV
jgi:hypothetical protein